MEIGRSSLCSILYAFTIPYLDLFKKLIYFPVAALSKDTPIE